MSKLYIEGIREYCLNALIVHDKFHVVQDWSKVMDRIRSDDIDDWREMAYESNIRHLIDFADMLKVHRSGLWSYCLYPIKTAILEANNRKVRLIRRKACGFHDLKYFILKIFQADNPLTLTLPVP